MQHDPLVSVEDTITACELILQFTQNMTDIDYYFDLKTKAAVEREFVIIGEALNRIKKSNGNMLNSIDNWREIIGFRNVITHGYDVVEDEIVWDAVKNNIPALLKQLQNIITNN